MSPMKSLAAILLTLIALSSCSGPEVTGDAEWKLDGEVSVESSEGIAFENDAAAPAGETATLLTKTQSFGAKRTAKTLTITQSPLWQNWNPIENIGPSNLQDAPVLLTKGPGDTGSSAATAAASRVGRKARRLRPFLRSSRNPPPSRDSISRSKRRDSKMSTMHRAVSSRGKVATMPGRAAT